MSGKGLAGGPPDEGGEEEWRNFLSQPDSMMRVGRQVFARIPSSPRCQRSAAATASVQLKGKKAPFEFVSLTVRSTESAASA